MPNTEVDLALAQELLARAREASQWAYAPYSHFPVGAALLAEDGTIFTGVNVENASYGLTNCAERTAIFTALTARARGFRAIAVWADAVPGGAVTPCGACRQVLSEFLGPDAVVIMAGEGEPRIVTMREILPLAFKL
jgi:cytidine deaminase